MFENNIYVQKELALLFFAIWTPDKVKHNLKIVWTGILRACLGSYIVLPLSFFLISQFYSKAFLSMCMNLYIFHVGRQGHFSTQRYLGLVNMNVARVTNRVGVQGTCSFTFQWQRDNRKKLPYNLQSCWQIFCHCQQIFQRSHTLQDIPIWFSVASLTTRENGCAERQWSTFVTVSGISYFQSATTLEYSLKVQKVTTGNKQ